MKIIVFTDLDSTLLDTSTYSWAAARPALDALKRVEAHLVLVSSKTFAEMESLHRAIGFADPYIVENGGGIVVPAESHFTDTVSPILKSPGMVCRQTACLWPLGTPYEEVVRCLGEISRETGVHLWGFSSMSDAEVSGLTGLSLEDARNARTRQFSEPFLVPEDALPLMKSVEAAAARQGFTMVKGGRFWHLMRHEGKGAAVSALIRSYTELYGRVLTVGLGDSPNDFPFLEIVDVPVLLGMIGCLPTQLNWSGKLRQLSRTGPEAWNQAVLEILFEERSKLHE